LGLSANPTAWDYWTDGPFADSYIDKMYDQGIIGERVFAIAMRGETDSGDSWMDVGFYDEDAMDNPDDLVWIESIWDYWWDDYWWHNYMTGLRFRDQVSVGISYDDSVLNADEIAIDNYEVLSITDSGSSCIALSKYVYDYVIGRLLDSLSYYEYDNVYGWGYLFYCSDVPNLPTFDVLFGDYWLEVMVDDYVVNFDGNTCAFCITDS